MQEALYARKRRGVRGEDSRDRTLSRMGRLIFIGTSFRWFSVGVRFAFRVAPGARRAGIFLFWGRFGVRFGGIFVTFSG